MFTPLLRSPMPTGPKRRRISPRTGQSSVTVVATGGYTHQPWLSEVPGIDRVEPDLTLRGIGYAWAAIVGRTRATAGER